MKQSSELSPTSPTGWRARSTSSPSQRIKGEFDGPWTTCADRRNRIRPRLGLDRLQKKLEITARDALADADEQRSEKQRLAQRVAVLERIVTDKGLQTADQIEALRTPAGGE
ncbi:MAG: hypothetical protein ABR588_10860 [Sphingomicrobium sp.]|nr:hypothetical protein [Sphingomonadales bacterium]